MKSIVVAMVTLCIGVVSVTASADPAVTTPRSVITAHSLTIDVRLAKPQVLVVLQRPTAVMAAGAAHERMHERMVAVTQPSAR
jgi:hypothetical protein